MPIITIKMNKGRSNSKKQELAKILINETSRILDCKSQLIDIIYEEVDEENWIFGHVEDEKIIKK